MAQSESQKRAQKNWISKVMTVTIRVDPRKDPDIARKLEEVENMSGYIKNLIKNDLR